jgi:hypothetical protein
VDPLLDFNIQRNNMRLSRRRVWVFAQPLMLLGPCRQVQNLTFLLILPNNARARLIQTPAFYSAGDPNFNEPAKNSTQFKGMQVFLI